MPVPVVESFTTQVSTTTSATVGPITKPSGVVVGDLLVILIANSDSTNTTTYGTHSGWNLETQSGNATPDAKAGLYWRVADGTEGTSESISVASGADYWVAWYIRISGADTEMNPIGQVQRAAVIASSAAWLMDGVTTNQPNTLAIAFWAYDGADATFTPSNTDGGSWPTSIGANQSLQSSGTSNGASGGWITQNCASEGTYTGELQIAASVADGFAGFVFTIAPQPANVLSGTVYDTDGSTPLSGVPVCVWYADDSSGTNPKMRRVVVTDGSGDWSARYPEGKTAFAMAFRDDSGTKYVSNAHGFLTGV